MATMYNVDYKLKWSNLKAICVTNAAVNDAKLV